MLQGYINNHSLTSINYTIFQNYFDTYVNGTYNDTDAEKIIGEVDWETWVRSPGLPPVTLNFTTENITVAKELAMAYIANAGNDTSPDNYTEYNEWYSSLKVVFLEELLE